MAKLAHSMLSSERLRHHYEVERELADRLRAASQAERSKLYPQVYDELYRRVPDHPQLTRHFSAQEEQQRIRSQMGFLRPHIKDRSVFLELGAGDCHLSFEVAPLVRKAYAVEVSERVSSNHRVPHNFELLITDGQRIPLPDNAADVVYSNQLMEHLHPDDAMQQLLEVYRVLRPGGVYLCVTPSRLNGPHDVSRHFTPDPTGFHLKEYTITELGNIFRKVGFSTVKAHVGGNGRYLPGIGLAPFTALETLLTLLPRKVRLSITTTFVFRMLLNVRVAGYKPELIDRSGESIP